MTPAELSIVERKAAGFGIEVPALMLAVALDVKLYPRADREALEMMKQTMADTGRVAGLLKYWLTGERKSAAGHNQQIIALRRKVKAVQAEIKEASLMLVGKKTPVAVQHRGRRA